MGNRAVITTPDKKIGIYLHWNGGRDSVEAFLAFCRVMQYRDPTSDAPYALARLSQTIANFFGPDGLSVGVGEVCRMDQSDNGVYIVGQDWQIIGREKRGKPYEGPEQRHHDPAEMLEAVAEAQPSTTQEAYLKLLVAAE